MLAAPLNGHLYPSSLLIVIYFKYLLNNKNNRQYPCCPIKWDLSVRQRQWPCGFSHDLQVVRGCKS